MELRSIKKRSDSSRVVAIKDTLRRAEEIARQIGVTRLANITYLDVLAIPNYSAVLPATEDYIWVYSGKGPTHAHAKASALMESIERYSSLPSRKDNKARLIRASYEYMSKEYGRDVVLHPDDVVEQLKFPFDESMVMDFVEGIDLFTNEHVYVPAGLVLPRYDPDYRQAINPFKYSHTNGLASGNVIEEAICHALCEVIERDAVSLAELAASAIPFHRLNYAREALSAKGYNIVDIHDMFIDDPNLFHDVDVSSVEFKYARYLINRFKEADVPLLIKDITSDIGIPTFIATSIQWITHDYGYLAEGHGTHPDANIALVRAITEVSQTRAANIQGARDDLRKMDYSMGNTAENKAWQFMHSKNKKDFNSIKSYHNDDILEDINLILRNLRRAGLDRAIIIDLTNSSIKIPVVRAIVPGLETFKVSKGIIGWRARRLFS